LEDLAYKNRELERMVFVDGLTGIQNRRYFDDTSVQEWKRAARERTPISLLIADIDFFKLYNDTYGHQKGDDCLRKVAMALSSTLARSGDFVSRYGGEEFVAVLPNTDMVGVTAMAKNMRSSVIGLKIPHKSSTVSDNVTISLGGGSVVPPTKTEPSGLISLVDMALYAAKQDGRNRIKIVDQESVERLYNTPLHFVDPSKGREKG
jgi:diguanylate cyclase (GGDEF)-like protein